MTSLTFKFTQKAKSCCGIYGSRTLKTALVQRPA